MFWDKKKDDEHHYKLKPELQKLADREEELFDHFYEGSYALPVPEPSTPAHHPAVHPL